jgi:hypothetical protein
MARIDNAVNWALIGLVAAVLLIALFLLAGKLLA